MNVTFIKGEHSYTFGKVIAIATDPAGINITIGFQVEGTPHYKTEKIAFFDDIKIEI